MESRIPYFRNWVKKPSKKKSASAPSRDIKFYFIFIFFKKTDLTIGATPASAYYSPSLAYLIQLVPHVITQTIDQICHSVCPHLFSLVFHIVSFN